ncbi:ABC transporter permease subunit [Actinomyces respiraculi]|uniref:ABC transporter permease subunit n=2 Tax=Actinomycetaceae TaxID=2049 RepID=A0A7T0PYB8_9ACTO|nr:ABC transporter permease subunit [Actinomyces respiraculi]
MESSMEPDMTTSQSPARLSSRSRRAPGARAATSSSGAAGQTFLRTLRSEWIKLRTLRSTWITAFIAILLASGLGAAFVIGLRSQGGAESWGYVLAGIPFGQIVVAVLGALAITGEYSSGQIRSSLAAVPNRWRLLVAKASVLALFSFVLGALSILIAWIVSAAFVGEAAGSLTDTAFLGFVWGTGLTYAGTALLAMGLGFLMRSTAGAITTVFTLLFVIDIPLNIAALKWDWVSTLRTFEPLNLAPAVYDPFEVITRWGQPDTITFLEHWQAALGFALWAVVPMVLAAVVFSRRDA